MIEQAKARLLESNLSAQELADIASCSSTSGSYSWAEIAAAAELSIKPGSMVRMEFAEGLYELVHVEAIEDGVVYGTGEDGEPFCSPVNNCEVEST